MKIHMVAVLGTTQGHFWPEPYALCGRFYPPVITTDHNEVTCARCLESVALEGAKMTNAKAPPEYLFGPTKREDVSYVRGD